MDTKTLAGVYENINQLIVVEEDQDEEDVPMLDVQEVERVLKASGVEDVNTEQVERAFKTVVDDPTYEMKASNIVPNYEAKSIKINTKVANIAISPQDLKYVKQVNYQGKRCLLIEVEEDTVIDGFTIVSQEQLR